MLDKIQADLVSALKKKDEIRVGALRMLLAAVHNREIELKAQGQKMGEEEILQVVGREVKKHKESIEAFRAGNRPELAEKEEKELGILTAYMPTQLTEVEVKEVVKKVIAQGAGDFGKIMSAVMAEVKGKTDGGTVSRIVKELLEK